MAVRLAGSWGAGRVRATRRSAIALARAWMLPPRVARALARAPVIGLRVFARAWPLAARGRSPLVSLNRPSRLAARPGDQPARTSPHIS